MNDRDDLSPRDPARGWLRGAALLLLGLLLGHALAQEAAKGALGPVASARSRTLTLRLRPGQDLRQELLRAVEVEGLEAAAIVTCVGSLRRASLRFANQAEGAAVEGHTLEIVSLVGTLSTHGSHLHLAVSDETGRTVGGHLLDGSEVYTTAEVVLVALDDVRFRREVDPDTTYRELVIERR